MARVTEKTRTILLEWLIWSLEGGFCINLIDKEMWNVRCVSYDWNTAGSREDAITMLRIVFQATVIGGVGCIMDY